MPRDLYPQVARQGKDAQVVARPVDMDEHHRVRTAVVAGVHRVLVRPQHEDIGAVGGLEARVLKRGGRLAARVEGVHLRIEPEEDAPGDRTEQHNDPYDGVEQHAQPAAAL